MKKKIYTLLNLALITVIIAVGCDVMQSGSDGPSKVQVQMQVETPSVAASSASTANQLRAFQDSTGIVIEEVKLFVEEMELDGTRGTRDFELEDIIINLPLDGSPIAVTEKEIPAGLYDEFELEIEKSDDKPVDDPDFRDETGDYSLVVKGTYHGEDFRFRSKEDFEIEMDLNPPLEIEESGSSVLVIEVGVSSWFRGFDGEDLDPKDQNNTSRINSNIEKSFEGFEGKFDDDDDDDDDNDNDNDDDDDDLDDDDNV